MVIHTNKSKARVSSLLDRRHNINPYELDTNRKRVIEYHPLELTSLKSVDETDETNGNNDSTDSNDTERNVLIQFGSSDCNNGGHNNVCQTGFNENIKEYEKEINTLLRSYRGSNIKKVKINENGCGEIDGNRKAILKLIITFKNNNNRIDVLSRLKTTGYDRIYLRRICDECRSIKFLPEPPMPIFDGLFDTLVEQNFGETISSRDVTSLFAKIETQLKKKVNMTNLIEPTNLGESDIEMRTSAVHSIRLILECFKDTRSDILSQETLRKILKYNIFTQLRESGAIKLVPKLEDLRKIAIFKLSLVNYNLIKTFLDSNNRNPLMTGITIGSLVRAWRMGKHKPISRGELPISNINFFQTREHIIEQILNVDGLSDTEQKNKVILFLIFGDYGIQPAIRL